MRDARAGSIRRPILAIGSNTFIVIRIVEPFWFFMVIVVALPMLASPAPAPVPQPLRTFWYST
jgi:hypothetical protein